MTTTFRGGSDFRACVQDSLAAQGKAPASGTPRLASRLGLWRARIGGMIETRPWAAHGLATGAALRARFATVATTFSGYAAAATSALRRRSNTPRAEEATPPSAAEALRARRAKARAQEPGAPAHKRNLQETRREIAAVQARLDAQSGEIAAPPDGQEKWAAELAREYRREFHPVEAPRKPAPAPAAENATAADGAAAALFVAGKVAWRLGLFLEPVIRFIRAHSAPILKVAAVGLVIVGTAGFLAQWPRSGNDEEIAAPESPPRASSAAPRPAWFEIQKPFHLFDLAAPQLAHEKRAYAARRHTTGGGREDVLTFGEFAGSDTFVRLSVYRHGSEKFADAAFFVDMARRASQLGLSLGRANFAQTQATRFGDLETAAMTMTEGRVTRDNCRGFRVSAEQLGLTVAGFACGAGAEAMSGADLACLVNRLDLLSAGEDRPLRDFFAAAQARGARGCAESPATPAKKRANEPKGLQENRAGGLF